MQKPGEIETKVALRRLIIGRCFPFLVNLFAIGGIGDTQCEFKMFRCEAALAIFSRQKTTGFAFDVEILFIARPAVPFDSRSSWVAQPGSKVNLVTDSIKMLWDVCRIPRSPRNFEGSFSLAQQPSHVRS